MHPDMMVTLGKMGGAAAFGLGAVGSALGSGVAGVSAVGAWKKCFAQNRPAPFILVGFMGAPLSQTIYGMILMNRIAGIAERQAAEGGLVNWPGLLAVGLFAGLAIGMSAWAQGRAAAGACDSFAETGKGVGNNFIALGVIETVAIFAMAFSFAYVGKFVAG
jgi:V/A-type H+-transporting ATPase subunit K